MKLIFVFTLTAITSVVAFAGNKQQDKENKEQLAQVLKIFVPGEGANIEKVRERIGRERSCFVLADARDAADAVLYVTAPDRATESREMSFQTPAGTVKGELKNDDDGTIWMGESQLNSSIDSRMGAGLAIASLVNSLEHDAGCGKKKKALARGSQ